MGILEYVLYGVCICIGWIAFRIAWYFFPNITSRRDRYHKSNWTLLNDRFVYALSRAIIGGGIGMMIIYILFNQDTIKDTTPAIKKSESIQVPNVPHEKKSTQKNILLNNDAKDYSIAASKLIKQWDVAHNTKNSSLLELLYMDYVRLNGEELLKDQCIAKKEILFIESQDYIQHSTLVNCEMLEENYIKCGLIKQIQSDKQEHQYNVYLFLKKAEGGDWQIEIEEY